MTDNPAKSEANVKALSEEANVGIEAPAPAPVALPAEAEAEAPAQPAE